MASCYDRLSRLPLTAASAALALVLVLAAGGLAPAQAGSGEPASQSFSKKTKPASTTAPAANNWSHAGAGGNATTVTQIVNDGSVAPFLAPDSASLLQAAAARYQEIAQSGGWPTVPGGKMKKGSTGKGVGVLNRRLYIEGYLRKEATEGEYAEVFTSATEDALKRYQRNLGLAVTGYLDSATQRELNVPPAVRLVTIRANIPRATEYSKDLGNRYVTVNIPAAQIETVSDGRVYSIHNAIVGRESRPTPVVMTALATVRFNPYWNAPASIVEKDIIPRMTSSGASKVMREMNMKIFQGVGGPEVDPDSVNWRRAIADDYHFRQEPGGSNAMATAKIEFNSPFGIYLHDTPEPHLFETGQRFYSSGCVRVQNVAILINWILQGQDGIDQARIANLAETKERLDVTIASPPQLRVVYLTAWPGKDGTVGFRPDVYQLDNAGFTVGQPLPVGETEGGQRFVLKPVPRSQQAVDADEASGFFAFFGGSRNSDKESATRVATASAADDSLVSSKSKGKTAVSGSKLRPGTKAAESDASGTNFMTVKPNAPKKKLVKQSAAGKKAKLAAATAKDDGKKKQAKATKKIVKTGEQTAAAKKPAAKTEVAEKKAAPAKATTADKCKPGKDGKLPEGCPAKPAAAKKPEVKPDKTASAAQ